jgi:hypothetical protein
MTTISTTIFGDHKVEVWHDIDPENPRAWDQLGTMACIHRRYTLGDEHKLTVEEVQSIEETGKYGEESVICLPLYLYDHSGLTISTKPFSCPWDSGKVGIIFVTHKKIKDSFKWSRITKARIEQIKQYLVNEVKEYDSFLTGAVYGYTLFDGKGEIVDSCGGHYGDWEQMVDYVTKGIKDPIIDLMEAANKAADPKPENGRRVRG